MRSLALIVIIISLLQFVVCENILILHPFYGGSHLLTLRRLADAMTEKNHQVTIVRWLDINTYAPISNPKITEIILSINNTDNIIPLVTHEERGRFHMPIKHMWDKGNSPSVIPPNGFVALGYYCQALLENEVLINQLQRGNFKVAIVDLIFNDCGLALAYKLGLPIIGFWGLSYSSAYATSSTVFNPPSSIPQLFSNLKDEMNFLERVTNTLYFLACESLIQTQYVLSNYIIRTTIPDAPYPSAMVANMSGLLINSHPAVDYPRLLPPSYLEVAGLHMKPKKELPEDISNFIDSSGEDGVIIFSLGFNFDSKYVPNHVFEAYFKAFGKLKQKVMVKAKGTPSYVPANVKIYSFFPQADILAHNKTVLFISHCGVHGVMEAIEGTVPIVGIPVFFDQRDNLIRLEQLGVAKGLDKDSTEDQIYEAVTSVLKDPRYKENMVQLKKRVKSFGDPLEKAVWLVTHVIETRGADHLKLASRHLNMIQYLGIDVNLFLVMLLVLFSYALFRTVTKITHSFREEKWSKVKTS